MKGTNFVDLRDAGDPVEQAQAYDAAGADELCFLDITASHEGRDTILDVVRRTAEVCFMPLTVGGGVVLVAEGYRAVPFFSWGDPVEAGAPAWNPDASDDWQAQLKQAGDGAFVTQHDREQSGTAEIDCL